jgi:DNA-binding response OmpR family regulator
MKTSKNQECRCETIGDCDVCAPAPARVLYVDDDPMMLRAVARVLRNAGFDVSVATEPPSSADGFDVVLADWDPHGLTMVRRAQAAGVPVVVYSGKQALQVDDIEVLEKPVPNETLVDALQKAIDERSGR